MCSAALMDTEYFFFYNIIFYFFILSLFAFNIMYNICFQGERGEMGDPGEPGNRGLPVCCFMVVR